MLFHQYNLKSLSALLSRTYSPMLTKHKAVPSHLGHSMSAHSEFRSFPSLHHGFSWENYWSIKLFHIKKKQCSENDEIVK